MVLSSDRMAKHEDISENAKNATIDRKDFDAALSQLLATPPMPKEAVSQKIARERTTQARKPQAQR